jgi:hypothetical protein
MDIFPVAENRDVCSILACEPSDSLQFIMELVEDIDYHGASLSKRLLWRWLNVRDMTLDWLRQRRDDLTSPGYNTTACDKGYTLPNWIKNLSTVAC